MGGQPLMHRWLHQRGTEAIMNFDSPAHTPDLHGRFDVRRILLQSASMVSVLGSPGLHAQVRYHEIGIPWNKKAESGPDAKVDGWYYNLGITGIRVILLADAPKHLLVKHIFKGSPAAGKVRVGDVIVGVAGRRFETPHRNGFGPGRFGAHGPILDFANALEACQARSGKGILRLSVQRGKKHKNLVLRIGKRFGAYGGRYPVDCKKSDLVLNQLLEYLVKQQGSDGSWGIPTHNTFAPLALLASGKKKYLAAVEKNVRMHARTTSAKDRSWLINWRYMSAAIVMSEYYLATHKKWVLKELQQVYAFLASSQYTDLSQLDPKSKVTHPDNQPKDAMDSHGGWGHNPGYEGYGPISMITGQGALAFALMSRCGIKVDRKRHEEAYAFLARSTNSKGYVWYEDLAHGPGFWDDMGRTGVAGIANFMSPYADPIYKKRALLHAKIIGIHPESFPDTHGSPIMGMGYEALAAFIDPGIYRRLMDANKWWFTLAQCRDGSFYYQPNRNSTGYGADSRISASAVTAFIFLIPKASLHMTGRPLHK